MSSFPGTGGPFSRMHTPSPQFVVVKLPPVLDSIHGHSKKIRRKKDSEQAKTLTCEKTSTQESAHPFQAQNGGHRQKIVAARQRPRRRVRARLAFAPRPKVQRSLRRFRGPSDRSPSRFRERGRTRR